MERERGVMRGGRGGRRGGRERFAHVCVCVCACTCVDACILLYMCVHHICRRSTMPQSTSQHRSGTSGNT